MAECARNAQVCKSAAEISSSYVTPTMEQPCNGGQPLARPKHQHISCISSMPAARLRTNLRTNLQAQHRLCIPRHCLQELFGCRAAHCSVLHTLPLLPYACRGCGLPSRHHTPASLLLCYYSQVLLTRLHASWRLLLCCAAVLHTF